MAHQTVIACRSSDLDGLTICDHASRGRSSRKPHGSLFYVHSHCPLPSSTPTAMKASQTQQPTSSLRVHRNTGKATPRESKDDWETAVIDQQRPDTRRQPDLFLQTKVDAGKASIKRAFKGKENIPPARVQSSRPRISSPRKLMSRAEAQKRFHGNASKLGGNMADKDSVSVHR